MASYTRYLAATAKGVNEFAVKLCKSPPKYTARGAFSYSREVRYSPILPAFLVPGKRPRSAARDIRSVTLLFANAPYQMLGTLKGELLVNERPRVYPRRFRCRCPLAVTGPL
jgi:hypothetical protein